MNGFLRFLRTAKNQHIICKFQLIVSLLCFDLDLNVFIRIFKQKIVLAFNKDYFCLKCFFNSEKLQNLDIAVKLRHFTVDLCSCCYTNICCNRPFFSASHAANVAFCFSITSSNFVKNKVSTHQNCLFLNSYNLFHDEQQGFHQSSFLPTFRRQ